MYGLALASLWVIQTWFGGCGALRCAGSTKPGIVWISVVPQVKIGFSPASLQCPSYATAADVMFAGAGAARCPVRPTTDMPANNEAGANKNRY